MKENIALALIVIILLKPGWLIVSSGSLEIDSIPSIIKRLENDQPNSESKSSLTMLQKEGE